MMAVTTWHVGAYTYTVSVSVHSESSPLSVVSSEQPACTMINDSILPLHATSHAITRVNNQSPAHFSSSDCLLWPLLLPWCLGKIQDGSCLTRQRCEDIKRKDVTVPIKEKWRRVKTIPVFCSCYFPEIYGTDDEVHTLQTVELCVKVESKYLIPPKAQWYCK